MLYALFAAMAAVLLAADQYLKAWVVSNIPLGETAPLIPGLVQLRTVHNYGAAWSSFSGSGKLLLGVTGAIVLAVVILVSLRMVRHPLGLTAAFLVISGGLGNIIDRARLGYVVDLFDLTFMEYPVFNVADIFVCVGCGLFILYVLLYEARAKKAEDAA